MTEPKGKNAVHKDADVLLKLSGVTKRFGKLVANDSIDMEIRKGEIHSILGENGAGKSTLMKMIFGVEHPNEGQIFWKGQPVSIQNPAQARKLGIGMVFQHFALFETVSVVDNIALTVPGKRVDLAEKIREMGDRFGLPVNPDALVHGLSVGEMQRVEIIRCLLQNPELLILDEPTSVLPPPSVEQLFKTLRQLSDQGVAILFISHKLEEIRAICHSVTILRHGQVTGHVDPTTVGADELAKMMIGREIPHAVHEPASEDGDILLQVHDLYFDDMDPAAVSLKNVNFEVRAGEIVGVAGVSGNGQKLLERLISGETALPRSEGGRIEFFGKPVGHLNAKQRRAMGMAYVPEERLGRGAAPDLDLRRNALLTAHSRGMVKNGFLQLDPCLEFTEKCIADMDVRCSGPKALAKSLSGGNLQKFIMGREMMLEPKILIVAQPTWGIDVGASAMVRQKLVDLREKGVAILVISEELEELFEISDRMVVINGGEISAPVRTRETDADSIGQMMIGHFEPQTRMATT